MTEGSRYPAVPDAVADVRIACPICDQQIVLAEGEICVHYVGIHKPGKNLHFSPHLENFWLPLASLNARLKRWGEPPTERDRFVRGEAPQLTAILIGHMRRTQPSHMGWRQLSGLVMQPYDEDRTAAFSVNARNFAYQVKQEALYAAKWLDETLPRAGRTTAGRSNGERLIGVYNGRGCISLSALLMGFADQAAAPADERTVLEDACLAWFERDYAATLGVYCRLVRIEQQPATTRLRALPTVPSLDETTLTTLLDRLRYNIHMRTLLDLTCDGGEEKTALAVLDHICQRCFTLDYHSALAAYWRLFPYGLPFHSEEFLPIDR